jgi:hypothetical protein
LYEIDRIISRTVSYTLLTGSLALLCVGVVGLVQRLTPVDNSSPLGVALSTLVVAALFQPARGPRALK